MVVVAKSEAIPNAIWRSGRANGKDVGPGHQAESDLAHGAAMLIRNPHVTAKPNVTDVT